MNFGNLYQKIAIQHRPDGYYAIPWMQDAIATEMEKHGIHLGRTPVALHHPEVEPSVGWIVDIDWSTSTGFYLTFVPAENGGRSCYIPVAAEIEISVIC